MRLMRALLAWAIAIFLASGCQRANSELQNAVQAHCDKLEDVLRSAAELEAKGSSDFNLVPLGRFSPDLIGVLHYEFSFCASARVSPDTGQIVEFHKLSQDVSEHLSDPTQVTAALARMHALIRSVNARPLRK